MPCRVQIIDVAVSTRRCVSGARINVQSRVLRGCMDITESNRGDFSRIIGLDGLRAVSVIVVMLYHAHISPVAGGFLGVEIFFVISGYLITDILLAEITRNGHIDLCRFWKRRFLRLIPALMALLTVVTVIGAFHLRDRSAQFRGDIVASLFYVENWYQIWSGSSYFADQGLPVLRHIWSLAVEEQFYLIWPLFIAAVSRTLGGRRHLVVILTTLLCLYSAFLMWILSTPDELSTAITLERLNRAYLGTDTRSFGILSGALLAMLLNKTSFVGAKSRFASFSGLLALLGLLWFCSVMEAEDPMLYRGGFAAVDLLTLLVISALVKARRSLLVSLLGMPFMEWIGQRSYGIYLWHWPVFRLVGEGHTHPGWVGARFVVTLIIAEASYRYLETPIRTGRFADWLAGERSGTAIGMRRGMSLAVTCLCVAILLKAGLLMAQQAPYVDEVKESMKAYELAVESPADTSLLVIKPLPPFPVAGRRKVKQLYEVTTSENAPGDPELPDGVRITAIGDSVMKGAALALKDKAAELSGLERLTINAEECRSFDKANAIIARYRQNEKLGDVVVIHLGTNNSHITRQQFDRLASLLADRRMVLFLTVKSDKEGACASVNTCLSRFASEMPNARLVDWKSLSEGHPDIFYTDRTHLRASGARLYASAIFSEISKNLK